MRHSSGSFACLSWKTRGLVFGCPKRFSLVRHLLGWLLESRGDLSIWSTAQAYWDGLIDYERKVARPEDLKLARMRALLAGLDDPQKDLRIVHVAGTKGKGSCCAMLESILRVAGWKTGLFVSPHISHVAERFLVNGDPINVIDLGRLIHQVKAAAEKSLNEPPTFFEVATAAAFLGFKAANCDWVVLETGLGGRLDSTNVCHPVVSVITGIGLDHTQILGDSLEEIAYEKAGIIKPGVPVISGAMEPGPRGVIRGMARQQSAPLWELCEDIHVSVEQNTTDVDPWSEVICTVKTPVAERGPLKIGLAGSHQARNAGLVVGVLDQLRLRGMSLPESAIQEGLAGVRWPGRLETICRNPWILLDAAHNVPSVQALGEVLPAWPVKGKKRLLFAVSRDKDVGAMLPLLVDFFDEVHLTRYTAGLRAMPPEEIQRHIPITFSRDGKGKIFLHESPQVALKIIFSTQQPSDGLCVAGSIFLLGEVRAALEICSFT